MEEKYTKTESAILEYIKSRDYAKVSEIKRYFEITNERTVRKTVERLREKGNPICIGSKGYYYSKDPEEIESTIRKLLSQAKGHITTAENLKKAKEKIMILQNQSS